MTHSINNAHRHRIGVVVQKYGLVGGGEKFVFELTERLALDPRWELHVFANQWRQASDAVQFHYVPIVGFPRFLKPLSFAYFTKRRIRAAGMDLVHTHERIFEADLLTAHGIPHASWVRDVRRKRPSLFDLAAAAVERRLVTSNRCRRIMAVSSLVEEKMVAVFPDISKKIKVIHPGVDTRPYDQLDRQACRTQIRTQFGIPESHRIILFVGMNFEVKGLDAIIAAVANLKRMAPDKAVTLLVVGKGDVKRYKELAHQKGIENDIFFTGVWRDEIAPVYMAADLFIMLSAFDTFGLAVLEAMAAGLPVIISPNVGARDIVRDGENGVVMDATDIKGIAGCIAQFLSSEKHQQLAYQSSQTAIANSWNTMVNRVSHIYNALIEST